MSGTSASGGFITNVPPKPPNSAALDSAIQQLIVGTTGLPGNLVRPRWQSMSPTQPGADTTWAAFGVYAVDTDDYPYQKHVGGVKLPGYTQPGYTIQQRHATVRVLITLYGPGAEDAAGAFSSAVYIQQNWDAVMAQVGCKLYETEEQARMPELVNNQWIDRIDLKLIMRRQVDRYYPIFDIAQAPFDVFSDTQPDP